MDKFVNLHIKTNASIMSSVVQIESLVKKLSEYKQTAAAIVNQGNLFDAIDFYKAMNENGIKPILGCEFNVVESFEENKQYDSLVLIAKNNDGWKNLKKLVTLSNKPEHYYYVPRISYKLIEENRDSLICLSGDQNGRFIKLINDDRIKEAEEFALYLKGLFPNDLYIEVFANQFKRIEYIRKHSREIADRTHIPCTAVSDTRYIEPEDCHILEVAMCINSGKNMSDPVSDEFTKGRRTLFSNDYYLKRFDDVSEIFTEMEIASAQEIAYFCNVEIDFKNAHVPKYHKTEGSKDSYEHLRKAIYGGLKERNISVDNSQYIDRIKKELKDIKEESLEDYFLILWDILRWCKSQNIRTGLGRGSVGGSLIAYLLSITEIDPIKYGLMFERFYNAGRKGSLPDIDTDVEIDRREDVIAYIRETFGENRVCQMLTLNRLSTKSVLKDVGKVFEVNFDEMNIITDYVPFNAESLKDAVEKSPELKTYQQKYKKIFTVAEKLEGIIKSKGSHAAGVVIFDEDFESGCVPLAYDAANEKLTTGFDMYTIDNLKYLKLDILGLRTISLLKSTEKLVNKQDNGVLINA